MKKKSYTKFILFGIILCIGLFFLLKNYFAAKKFEYAGTLETTKIDISSQLNSLILNVNVHEGDLVTENQALVSLNCKDVKLADELANINYDRSATLFASGTVSRDAFDQVKNAKEVADLRRTWCDISSPLTGTVLSRYHEPGELASVGTKILTLGNIKDIWAYIYVPQPDVASLKIGQKLKATLPELNNRVFIGTIIKINEEAEFTPKNVQTKNERERLIFGVKVSFLGVNNDEILKPGMTVYIESLAPMTGS